MANNEKQRIGQEMINDVFAKDLKRLIGKVYLLNAQKQRIDKEIFICNQLAINKKKFLTNNDYDFKKNKLKINVIQNNWGPGHKELIVAGREAIEKKWKNHVKKFQEDCIKKIAERRKKNGK